MKFEKLEKISGGAFLHRYDITYSDEKDRRFTYEMVSRDPQLDSFEKLRAHKPDAVVMALTDRARELREETGLELVEIKEILPAAACAVGISDEQTVSVLGVAEGELHPAPGEDTQARWYTRDEIRALHQTDMFGSWALAYSWMWVNGKL